MSTTRRTILSGALAVPFFASLPGTASADTPDETFGTASGGFVEILWTRQVQDQLNLYNATVETLAPATLITKNGRKGVRFPVLSGAGDPSLGNLAAARGSGAVDGGLTVWTARGRLEVTQLRPALENEVISGTCKANGVESGGQPMLRCDSASGTLKANPVRAGQPLPIRMENVPVRPTQELLDMIESTLGAPGPLTLGTVLGHATAETVYIPPGS